MNRRRFLQGVGAGAAASAFSLAPGRVAVASPTATSGGVINVFGRMFPELPAFAEPSEALTEALQNLGRRDGVLDARDDLEAGPVALLEDPQKSLRNPDNPQHTAGTTFFGQFIDHDITFDASSNLGTATEPGRTRNERTPALDLDSVYGAGPIHSSHLYDARDAAKLRIESGGRFEDLPRTSDMTALIGDPRNDENLVIAGLQCAFILFHNNAVDYVRSLGGDRSADFEHARRLTTWHYQWIVVHEFLPQVVGQDMVDEVLQGGRRFYQPETGAALMPVEFQGAAFRFGHSMVRPSYRANFTGEGRDKPFVALIFDPDQTDKRDPDDLVGGFRARRRFIGWQTFFDFGDGEVKPNKLIDTRISTPLFTLPLSTIAGGTPPTALPERNLLRHLTWSMPSGQDVARQMHVPPLSPRDLSDIAHPGLRLEKSTPLWYYILREAELQAGGHHLGEVGGRIVAEVLLGLLESDPASYLNAEPRWRPTLGRVAGEFSMVDFLTFAGVHEKR